MHHVIKRVPRPSDDLQPDSDLPIELPSPDLRFWVPRHKAAVVAAVRSGLLTIDEACRRYMLSEEEFQSWKVTIDQYGIVGLRASPRERRRVPRKAISEPATAALYAGTVVECVITNISDVGARLKFGAVTQLPSSFELHCKKSGRSWVATPVWESERTAGIRFINPLHPPWSVKSGLADWLLGKRRTVVIDRVVTHPKSVRDV
jgi:hypothetical protein